MVFHASEFHFGVDVVKMHIFNLCNCRICVFSLGRFPVPMDDGLDLGINNPLLAEYRRIVAQMLLRVPLRVPLENLLRFP